MNAFYFGPPERQLFGYHHVPRGPTTGAALLCPPWASEYQCAHRALNLLGRRLAARGCHVLRFDYSGTGDSWGDSTEADTTQWAEDSVNALRELRTMSGVEKVDLVGLRFGAFVAVQGAAEEQGVRRVVLWDPVTEGEAWLQELGESDAHLGPGYLEVGNTVVSTRFVEQIRGIRPAAFEIHSAERVLLLVTQRNGDGNWPDTLPHLTGVDRERLEQPAPWIEDQSIWTGQVPVEAVKRIAEWLS